ncbi:hypothetical protein LAZ67_1001370 [Cordylochernes scorpioides]|uniref:DUF5641 domain-containing protein n=1 Tax=Cordylochernes scorpioides TaxID=51811 RepID=A0ABY6JWV4_9ARAC|nr:hypothetical protein LAZ67_1001370 [Cordylochernes scorpioides]
MKKNLKLRTLLRSSATKNIREIEEEMETESPSRETIGIKLEVLETIENQLRDANVQVMNLLLEDEAISSPDLEKEQDMVVQYEESFVRTKRRVAKYLQVRETGQQGRDTLDPARSAQEGMSSCKLPKMALPVFDGTCLEWMGWWSRFEMIHESAVLTEVEKFQYLVQSMKAGTRADRLVKSYPLTTENYPKVVKALQDRFGDKVILTEVYVRQLLKLVESHLRALESLGVTTQQNASFLYPLVESSLPEDLLRIWQRSALAGYGGDELELPITIDQRLERLLEFLRREVKGDQRLEYMKEGFGESSQRRNYGQHIARMHAAQITEAKGRDCAGWRSMTVTKRRDEIRKFNACFRCLRVGHVIATCRTQFRCSHCKGFHHTALHLPRRVSMEDQDQRERQNTEEPRISPGEQEIALSGMHVRTAIPTALLGDSSGSPGGPSGRGSHCAGVTGSGVSVVLCPSRPPSSLDYPVHKVNAQIYGINDTKGEHVKQMVSCSVASLTESGWTIPIRALVVGRMTGILPSRDLRIPVPSSWKTLPLADIQFETSGRVDVILGADVYGSLLLPEVKYDEKTQLCAQNTRLGWIVSGKLPGEREVGPQRVYNIRVNYGENLDNLDADEFCEELYKTRGMAKMERHEKRMRTPASRTDGYGSERVKVKVDKLCPASAMVKVTERKTCPDSSVQKRSEESTCPDCSKVKGSMCPHCAKMKEIEMLTCTDSAKVKAELCPDSSKVEVDKEEPSPELWPKLPKDRRGWKRWPDIKPKEYDHLEEKENDRRILSIDELAEELLESYKEFPPVHVKVDRCGNLDEHWLRRKIREDLCQVPPKIPPYIRMSDSTKLKVEKLRKMAYFLKSTNVLGDLQTNVVNLDIVEELLKSRPKCENRESELDIYENLDLEQRTLDVVHESNIENPNCEEKMADSKLVQSHVEICRIDEEPNEAIGTPRIEISEVSVIDKSEGKDSKEPMTKPVPVEIVDPSTKDYLQSGEKAKLSRWKLIDSLCLEDFKESENDDEKVQFIGIYGMARNFEERSLKTRSGRKSSQTTAYRILYGSGSDVGDRGDIGNDGAEWKFSPPGAPHFGGLWEAGIKCFKYHFRRIIGETLLTYEGFLTLIVQMEACLNSRPLDQLVATPWSTDYIHNLQQRHKWRTPRPNVATGSLVLSREEHVPPAKWILGRVVENHPGKDGLVRVSVYPHQGWLTQKTTGCRVFQYLSAPWKTFKSSHKIQAVVVEAEWKAGDIHTKNEDTVALRKFR